MLEGPSLPREHRQWTPLARALAATGDQWTLLIILALAHGPMRLSELRRQLPGVSTGVLNRHLHQMAVLDLIARQRYRELPPRVEYRLTARSRALLPIVASLARWGMVYMWSDPQAREEIDIGAILRLLPTLLDGTRLQGGVIEMVVELPGEADCHLFNLDRGRLTLVEPGSLTPWTSIKGRPHDWIDALGPSCKTRALKVKGDEELAGQLLQALPRME